MHPFEGLCKTPQPQNRLHPRHRDHGTRRYRRSPGEPQRAAAWVRRGLYRERDSAHFGAALAGSCAALDHGDLCRCGGRGRTPHRRPPLDLTRRNLMGGILWQPHANMGDGQRTGTRALTAWRPDVGSPSSPVGRLCHGYCVPPSLPLHKISPPLSVGRLSSWRGWLPGAMALRLLLVEQRLQQKMMPGRVIILTPPAAPWPPAGRRCQTPR